ncbi:hypothetical protein BKG82_26265 [Mycobacteroides chelonae]|uniref:Uncharacterized protein n=1 Tax=Mycobacteroides chelonae TaxID=1774 RepID=A0A1S1LKP1_MYCCH|nr:helix-turn-helix domain-containing protein [Mycobacteroides chelonae]OHU47164.1 hypothetical protein BKG82_26265 [Mycobacteroides chelonae]
MAAHPEPESSSRRPISTAQAKKYLGIDSRTAREHIRNGKLKGYDDKRGKKTYYYFYLPEPPEAATQPSANAPGSAETVESLKAENTQLRQQLRDAEQQTEEARAAATAAEARAAAANDTNAELSTKLATEVEARRLLTAAQAGLIDASQKLQKGSAGFAAAAGDYKDAADDLLNVIADYRDAVALLGAPTDIGDL